LLAQYKGLEDSGSRRTGLSVEKIPDTIPPALHAEGKRIFKSLTQFDQPFLLGQESNRVDSFKGKMTLVRESPRIMKSVRGVEFTEKPEAIPDSKGRILLFKEDQEKTVHGDVAVR
jgi:hypothetical protein